jgi:ankyrin repeat protein
MNDKIFEVSSKFYYKVIDAAEDGNFDGLDALLKEGADINVRSLANGRTALMKVCGCIKNPNYANEAINYLVKNGANICLHDDRGNTALMIYLSSNNPEYTDISSVRLLASQQPPAESWWLAVPREGVMY